MKKTIIIFAGMWLVITAADTAGRHWMRTGYTGEAFAKEAGHFISKEMFTGTWRAAQINETVHIFPDGRWSTGTNSGQWTLKDGNFVWIFEEASSVSNYMIKERVPERIIEVQPDEFVLKEPGGAEVIFERI